MPEFGKSAVILDATSIGVGSTFWSTRALGGGLAQYAGTSFDIQIQGTNFFDPNNDVGSFWLDVGSRVSQNGFQVLPPVTPFAAYRCEVNSLPTGAGLKVALSF